MDLHSNFICVLFFAHIFGSKFVKSCQISSILQRPNTKLTVLHASIFQADSGKLGSTDGSPTGRSSSDSAQDFFGQVPEYHQWSVPDLPSASTASGLH